MFRKFLVKKDERAVLLRAGDFVKILHPGEHWLFDPLRRFAVEVYPLKVTEFQHRLADYLRKAEPELVEREFHVIALGAADVGLRYENGVLVEVLAPNTRRLHWKGYIEVRHDVIDIGEAFRVKPELVPALVARNAQKVVGADAVLAVQVPQYHVALLYVDGKVHDLLEAGLYAFWRFNRELKVELVDLRLQVLEVTGQEILTKDKVNLRVNLTAKVVEADKAAQANVIRRREETAATRSLLNTAKVMEDNPVALRLKELETLEKVTEKIGKISVYGGLDSVLKDLVKIRQ